MTTSQLLLLNHTAVCWARFSWIYQHIPFDIIRMGKDGPKLPTSPIYRSQQHGSTIYIYIITYPYIYVNNNIIYIYISYLRCPPLPIIYIVSTLGIHFSTSKARSAWALDPRHCQSTPCRSQRQQHAKPWALWEDPGDTGEFVYSLLVGGAISPSWKIMEFVNGKDDIPYIMESHRIPWFQTTNHIGLV
jgi:hypothetical protein